jgi:hypothetical protein
MKLKNLLAASVLTLGVSTSVAPAALAVEPVAAPANVVQAPEGTRRGSATDQRRYAEKAAESHEARNYRGGDTVVISASALAVVLLIVLVIILI